MEVHTNSGNSLLFRMLHRQHPCFLELYLQKLRQRESIRESLQGGALLWRDLCVCARIGKHNLDGQQNGRHKGVSDSRGKAEESGQNADCGSACGGFAGRCCWDEWIGCLAYGGYGW
jgi:hypothetical protein